jgi:hypothetical protein
MIVFAKRMLRAALLRADLYEEVEADRGATGQAFAVVVLSAVATGLGALENSGPGGLFWHTVIDVVGWYVWAWLTYMIGTRLLPTPETRADVGQLLRTLGFASAPGVLRIAALIDPLAFAVFTVATLWMLVAMVVAVRQALDYTSTGRAVAVCAIGFPIYALGQMLSILALGPWPL